MRKVTVFATVMLTLLTLMALMPTINATVQRYWWDGVYFIEGRDDQHDIKYPHPDRDYYDISAYNDWREEGYRLYHTQWSQQKSLAVELTCVGMGAAIGVTIGAIIGGMYGAILGGMVGIALGIVIPYIIEVYCFDENDCIWWWTSIEFIDWLSDNAWWLGILCYINPAQALNDITNAFLDDGYLRVGSLTFYDDIAMGIPSPPSGGGCPILSVYDGTEYVEEGLMDIHNPDGIDEVATRSLTVTSAITEHRYLLQLTEHNQTHSHIDQVQLFATSTDGTITKLPLVSAVHSEDGNVLQELLFSDDVRADTLGADHNNGTSEYINLEFTAPEGLEIQEFRFWIEGHNIISKK